MPPGQILLLATLYTIWSIWTPRRPSGETESVAGQEDTWHDMFVCLFSALEVQTTEAM